ncbi:MAG: BPSS1780 family membrane protein [Candidatus Thiodiazotropha sp.]
MAEGYKVIFTGELKPNTDQERLIALFSQKFNLGPDKAQKLIQGGRPVALKKGLELEKAEKYLEALEKLGMVMELDPKPEPPQPSFSSELALEDINTGDDEATEVLETSSVERCPKCGSTQMEMGICQSCGIVAAKYIAAQVRDSQESGEDADVAQAQPPGEDDNPYSPPDADLEDPLEGEMVGPRSVSLGRPFAWIAGGWGHFKESPLAWILSLVIWLGLNIGVSLIPLAGAIAVNLIAPTLIAGFMIGCREQEEGGQFSVSHLFAGFSQNTGQTILIGLFYMITMLVLTFAMVAVIFGNMSAGMMTEPGDVEAMSGMMFTTSTFVGLGIAFVIFILVFFAYLFAPALAGLESLSAWESMKLSFVGSVKNILPLILYGILAMLLMMLGSLPVGLGLLVVIPVLIGAMYTAFKDIYYR